MTKAALIEYLEKLDATYYGKSNELRDSVVGWLNYIPNTFPHYTRHTVEHSDEIILQLSKLLFWNDDPEQPVIKLSAVEAYILIASAYLHDAGMVCSDEEKLSILESDEWSEWTEYGAGRDRWLKIQKLRAKASEDTREQFVADIQTRFLVAEFVRLRHHSRSADILEQHHNALGRCAFDDPVLATTIGAVCEGHGLHHRDLEDKSRYPEERDILGEKVNVRLMACLLRIGDLLDMTFDRACPLLLNVACPLPADSLAHWSQYRTITHRLTKPNRIEISAECDNQDEHRVLQDWCQWIVDEVSHARLMFTNTARHGSWEPPVADFGPANKTIEIKPNDTAKYIPTAWRLTLDEQAVLDRLINDVYEHRTNFVRELLQNAADACRCQMYLDLHGAGVSTPRYPNEADKAELAKYPIHIKLENREFDNELAGGKEQRQVLTIDDPGIGMDRRVISDYFLQVGRSYYTSAEFRREFDFSPTSRFGIGFLSVFSVSDDVTVDTWKPSSASSDGPIRMRLTGPRNYLLTETGHRQKAGTRIQIVLSEGFSHSELTECLESWCRRLEFPIVVDDLGSVTSVTSETAEMFECESPDYSTDGGRWQIRSYPLAKDGVFGETYVFVRVLPKGESWAARPWAKYKYAEEYPQADVPEMPSDLRCWNGISFEHFSSARYIGFSGMASRVDFRGKGIDLTLSRTVARDSQGEKVIRQHMIKLLQDHLSTSPFASGFHSWKYLNDLCSETPISVDEFWGGFPGIVPYKTEGTRHRKSLREFSEFREFAVCLFGAKPLVRSKAYDDAKYEAEFEAANLLDVPTLIDSDLRELDKDIRKALFDGAAISKITKTNETVWELRWSREAEKDNLGLSDKVFVAPIDSVETIGILGHKSTDRVYERVYLNEGHEFTQWLIQTGTAAKEKQFGLSDARFAKLVDKVCHAITYGSKIESVVEFVERWARIPGLPPELAPPSISIKDFENATAHFLDSELKRLRQMSALAEPD